MKRLFLGYVSFDDPRCKKPIPHSLETINDAVLYISGETLCCPSRYPFSSKCKRGEVERILSDYILDRLLNRSDNNSTRNYLLGSIEYCLLSSSSLSHNVSCIGLIQNVSFLNTFVSVFLSQYKAMKKLPWLNTNDVLLLILLRILDLFLVGSKNDKEKQHRMKSLASNDKLMERLCLMCNHNIRRSVHNALIKLITYHSYLIDPLIKLSLSKMSKYYGMIEILLSVLTQPNNVLFDTKYRKEIGIIILNDIISAKEPPNVRVRESFGIYFRAIQCEEFKDIFLNELERMMKRNSAETTKTLIVILSNIMDLRDVQSLAPLLMNELKHKEIERRSIAFCAFKLYITHIADINDLCLMIELLKNEYKHGDRALFVECFSYLHNHCHTLTHYTALTDTLTESLIMILNKESNHNVRESILNIINDIVQNIKIIPSSINAMLTQCLVLNKTMYKTVQVLVNVLRHDSSVLINDIICNKSIWDIFTKCIKKKEKKDAKNGLSAILAILYLCDNNDKLFCEYSKLIINTINEYKMRYIFDDSVDVNILRLKIIDKLCSSFYLFQYNVMDDESNFSGVWHSLLFCALHCDYRVRRYSCNIIKQINGMNLYFKKKKSVSFSCLMVNLLYKFVSDLLSSNTCYMFPEKVKSGEMKQYQDIPLPIALSECLKAIAAKTPHKDSIIYILFLSHYPWFNINIYKMELWQNIVNEWHKTEQNVKHILMECIHNNKQFEELIRTNLTRIKYELAQNAIMNTIAAVFKLSPKLITQNERILATVDHALNSGNDILHFTEKEKQICSTPEGVLCVFDCEHKSRSEAEKDNKKRKRSKKATNIRKKEKLLVKTVQEKGTKRLITDEEWEEEQRKELAIKSGAAEKEKQHIIEQQSFVRKKLETVRFRLHSVFRLFEALIRINHKDFAQYLSLKYIKNIVALSESQLLIDDCSYGLHIILRSFCLPIKNQSKTIASLLIKHHIYRDKLFQNTAIRSLITNTMQKLRKDSKVPEIKVSITRQLDRKKRRHDKGKGKGKGRGRGRGGVRGRGGGRGRGGAVLRGRGRGGVRGRGRGRGIRGRGRGRGRGGVTAVVPSQISDKKDDEDEKDDNEEEEEDNEEDLFTETYDILNRWNMVSFVALFPLMKSILMNIIDRKRKNKFKFRVNKSLPNWVLSIIILHCHDALNMNIKCVYFPCCQVSVLLLKCIDYYPLYCKAITYGLCRLSGSLSENNKSELSGILSNDGCLSSNVKCRKAALLTLCNNECVLYPQSSLVSSRIWILCHDVNDNEGLFIRNKANNLWKSKEFSFCVELMDEIICCLNTSSNEVRKSMALSLGSFCLKQKSIRHKAVSVLITSYKKSKKERIFRDGISLCLGAISSISILEKHYVMQILDFLLKIGLYEADHSVYRRHLECGRSLFGCHGSLYGTEFLDKLENALSRVSNSENIESDWVRQGNVIFTACLVEQIEYCASDKSMNDRVLRAMDRLMSIIITPNYDVQYAVCDSLQHLIVRSNISSCAQTYVNKLLHILTSSSSLAARRGAAMGIASVVKGLKIPCVSSLGIMDFLAKSVNNKQQWIARHGALLAYKELFSVLGTAFEPFVIKVLPHLLTRFGDDNTDVRKATAAASKAVMKNLSNFGIKMVLPLVLVALDKNDWRTKVQSSQMLGQMAYCAPKVLSTYLPQIIPKLNNVICDPKKEVSSAATSALKNIGSVVRNPEIASLVPLLIEAITRGGDHTKRALSALINTSFTNVVDVPSLALIIPILTSAMSDRSSSTKKMAAQVIGGICSLIADPRSIIPYIDELLDGIRTILIDPIPEVRSASAAAIRSLNESLSAVNTDAMNKIYLWLMKLLNDSSTNNVQRFGAAQGLSELLASYHSDERIQQCLSSSILGGLRHKNAIVRESFCQIFVYFAAALGSSFPYWMEQCIPPLLQLLGDDSEAVRSCCLKGLKIMVFMFHSTEYDLLLELLEEGLENSDYRVRDSTLILIGDLLNGLAGNEGSVSYETSATSSTENAILSYLGDQRRNEVFSLIYMARSDGEQPVRSRANITWKGLVYNSSKMLKSILDTLMHALITALSCKNRERQEAASKSLGDLVKNAGQFIIPKIIPILKRGLLSVDNVYKEGIALGLAQVTENAHPRLICDYRVDIIESISLGICDKLARVRSGSGKAFNIAVRVFGKENTINQIVPNTSIDGLRELLSSSSPGIIQECILPYLMNVDNFNLKRMSLLSSDIAQYCSSYLNLYICDIFTLSMNCINCSDIADINKTIIDICPQQCTHLLLTTMTEYIINHKSMDALHILSAFICNTSNDLDANNYAQLISAVLKLFNDSDCELRMVAWNTLNDIMSHIPDEEIAQHIDWFRRCLSEILPDCNAFCCKSGLKPVMRMFDYGIRNGSFEERAAAASLMCDLINLTNLDSVQVFLNKIAGALIRICADRFPSSVKCAILETLSLLINKYGKLMKGFYTPLQTTFVKVIHDPSRDVRRNASNAIQELMQFSPKFDNLLRDLNNYLKNDDNNNVGVTISILSTMSSVLLQIGPKVKQSILNDINLHNFGTQKDDSLRFAASKCISSILHCCNDSDEKNEIIINLLDIDDVSDDWRSIEYDLNSLAFIIANNTLYNIDMHKLYHLQIITRFETFLESQQVTVKIAALRNGYYLCQRIADFKFNDSLQQIISLLDKHLLPLLEEKVNQNNQDIVHESIQLLLQIINADNDYIWCNPDIHQLIIPYLCKNHLNNIHKALIRQCIIKLFKIDINNIDLKYYNKFVSNCNHKNAVKELTAIIQAITKTYN